MPNIKNEKRFKNRILVFLGSLLGPLLLRFLYNTNKIKIINDNYYEDVLKSGKSVIIASWHSTLLTTFMSLSQKNYYGMASNHHPDAEIISRVGKKLGWNIVRGSSTDGGKEAYNKMLNILNKPGNLFAITPDGPQGPAKKPKAGTIKAAIRTGAVIVPTSGQTSKFWSFKNWHTFYLSKPFGSMVQIYGKPISFNVEDDFSECVSILKHSLDELEKQAMSYFNK